MVQDSIIEKLGLKERYTETGSSFIYNEKIYLWPDALEGIDTYVMGCNSHGIPLTNGNIQLYMRQKEGEFKKWWSGKVTTEFLENLDIEIIKKFLQYNINHTTLSPLH